MKRRTVFAALVGLSLLAALFVGSALAVHDEGIFELAVVNGQAAANTWDDPSVPGEDWADVYAKSLDASKPLNAFAFAFITDGVGQQEASFFTGGGSKDVNDIPDWLYATVNDVVPDKDDIEHAFAAAYEKAGERLRAALLKLESDPSPKASEVKKIFGPDGAIMIAHGVRFRSDRNIFAELCKDRINRTLFQCLCCGDGVIDRFARHEPFDRLTDEPEFGQGSPQGFIIRNP